MALRTDDELALDPSVTLMDRVRASADRTWIAMSDQAKAASLFSPTPAMRAERPKASSMLSQAPRPGMRAELAAKARVNAAKAMPKKGPDCDIE